MVEFNFYGVIQTSKKGEFVAIVATTEEEAYVFYVVSPTVIPQPE